MQKDIDITSESMLIYVCVKKELIPKILKIFKKKYSENNVYRTMLDVEKLYSKKPVEVKFAEGCRDESEWLEWLIQRVDQIWIADNGDYHQEVAIARKYMIPIRRN